MGLFNLLSPLLLAAGTTASPECAPIPGWEHVVADKQIRWIVIGEVHGTNEIPAIFADAVCLTASSRRVVVGVEQPSADQSAIDAFMNSDGGAAAKAAFLSAGMWNQPAKDGRSSEASFRLFEILRQMRANGLILSVIAFQPSLLEGVSTQAEAERVMANFNQADYEKSMARLIEAAAQPDSVVLVLTGGFHAMLAEASWGPGFVGMAGHLPRQATLSFNAVPNGGESWTCQGQPIDCGPHPHMDEGRGHARELKLQADSPLYSGVLYLGSRITASTPQAGTAQTAE